MPGKRVKVRMCGLGVFPRGYAPPTLAVVVMNPLHTSDQWEARGRPFWVIKYGMLSGPDRKPGPNNAYARTMTPTYCTLGVVCVTPLNSGSIYVGVPTLWLPAQWEGHDSTGTALRAVGRWSKLNMVQIIHADFNLTGMSAALYAQAGNLRVGSERPVRSSESQWRPGNDTDAATRAEVDRLLDDGCPNVSEA